jgi:hypothetical protein
MPTLFLPYQRDPIAGGLTTPNAWYEFFGSVRKILTDSGLDPGVIADILSRLSALEEDDGSFLLQGNVSVAVFGTPSSGLVQVLLVNDVTLPGNTYYYGTGPTGVKGWFTVASAFTAAQPGIELVTGADGVTDIRPDDDLEAVEGIGTAGLATRTAANTWTTRTITAGSGIAVTDGDGVAGNPTVAHADTSSAANLTSDNANGVVLQDIAFTFDTFGHVTAATVATADVWTLPASSYRTILQASSIITAGSAAGTYALTAGGDGCVLSGADTAIPLQTIYIDSADYPTIGTLTPKLRIRVQLYTNDTAPTGNYTFGLYPVTRPGTSGGSGVNVYTLGTVVTGSDGATFTAPAADGLLNAVGADFALPSNGHYVIGVLTTTPPVANANIQITAYLQMRNA